MSEKVRDDWPGWFHWEFYADDSRSVTQIVFTILLSSPAAKTGVLEMIS